MPDPGHLVRARNAQRNAMRFFNEGNDEHAALNASLALSSSILALTEMMERRAEARATIADLACPHWSPGRVTMRTGCTACEAERREVRYGEKRVVLRRADELLEGVMYSRSPADEPPLIEIDGMQTLAQSVWLARGWSILDWRAGS